MATGLEHMTGAFKGLYMSSLKVPQIFRLAPNHKRTHFTLPVDYSKTLPDPIVDSYEGTTLGSGLKGEKPLITYSEWAHVQWKAMEKTATIVGVGKEGTGWLIKLSRTAVAPTQLHTMAAGGNCLVITRLTFRYKVTLLTVPPGNDPVRFSQLWGDRAPRRCKFQFKRMSLGNDSALNDLPLAEDLEDILSFFGGYTLMED